MRKRIASVAPLIASVIVGLLAWQLIVTLFHLPSYVLPSPASVWVALVAGLTGDPFARGSYWYQLWYTVEATVLGFVIGSTIGFILAAAMAESRLAERFLMPYVAGLQSLPKVAIAPLFVIWFGFQLWSQVAMAATLTLFPVLMSTLQGLTTTPHERLELLTTLKSSRWQQFRYAKFPGALPLIFAGLNLGIVYALLGAIVSEFLGAQRGMGVIMTQLQSVSDTAGVFAGLVVLAVTGYVMIAIVRFAHRRIVFWDRDTRLTSVE